LMAVLLAYSKAAKLVVEKVALTADYLDAKTAALKELNLVAH